MTCIGQQWKTQKRFLGIASPPKMGLWKATYLAAPPYGVFRFRITYQHAKFYEFRSTNGCKVGSEFSPTRVIKLPHHLLGGGGGHHVVLPLGVQHFQSVMLTRTGATRTLLTTCKDLQNNFRKLMNIETATSMWATHSFSHYNASQQCRISSASS